MLFSGIGWVCIMQIQNPAGFFSSKEVRNMCNLVVMITLVIINLLIATSLAVIIESLVTRHKNKQVPKLQKLQVIVVSTRKTDTIMNGVFSFCFNQRHFFKNRLPPETAERFFFQKSLYVFSSPSNLFSSNKNFNSCKAFYPILDNLLNSFSSLSIYFV